MRRIGLEDVLGRERYGQARDAIRRRLIEHKRSRRVGVGDRLSLVFEDRATVWYQTQEMVWVENITDLDAIRAELEIYNALLPDERTFAATLFIEVPEQSQMREEFQRLLGIDRHLRLEVGPQAFAASFEEGRQTDDKISAVQYVRFPLGERALELLRDGAPVAVVADHPRYQARVALADPIRTSVVGSFLDPAAADRDLRRVREGS
jgi:hypothetical protein